MINWLYPERCPVCLKIVTPKGTMVHPECRSKIDSIKEPVCYKCGIPLSSEEQEYCKECSCRSNRGWDYGRSVFPYHGSVGNALRLVKKDGRAEFVRFFAKQINENQKKFILRMEPDCIVPVPLHPAKHRVRGFNQAELLARALGEEMNLPVCLLLKKKKKTKEQKSLSKNQRMKNVADVFAVEESEWQGRAPKSVLLLDDVSTTGSTLTACANALKTWGVKRVSFVSVCVAEQLK